MRSVKYILFILLIVGMIIPATQKYFQLFEVKPLHGDFKTTEQPMLSTTTWMDGSFQTQFDSYLEQNIGFRPFLVRLNNQLGYSLFNVMSNKNIVKGKDDYLFEKWFIDTYDGKDFVGIEKVDQQVEKLIAIDSVLKSRGIHFIITLAPGKADVFPEKIPNFMIGDAGQQTNYKVYRDKLSETDIAVIDINKWFMQTKPEFDRNLFTKGGTHWSRDAAMMALDSLLKQMENVSGELRNQIQIDKITKTRTPKKPDVDILKISNLLYDYLNTDYYYPEFHFEETHLKKGKLISISDSFFWIFFNSGLKKTFVDVKYWYYFNTVFPDNYKLPTTVNNIGVATELLSSDFVLLMCSPANLKKLGWGFIDKAYDVLVKDADKELTIERIIASIKSDPKWFASVKAKAVERNIELDSMLILDAEYVYKRK